MEYNVYWYRQLPTKVRLQWKHNRSEHNRDGETDNSFLYLIKSYDFDQFICSSFVWSKTPEGHDYWDSIAKQKFKLVPTEMDLGFKF